MRPPALARHHCRRGAAHPGAPVPAGRGAGPAAPGRGHRLGPGHRGSDHRGRLRRRVPLRPPAGWRHAGARARAGRLRPSSASLETWLPGCASAGWRCPPGWPTRWPPPAPWPTGTTARSTSSPWPSSSAPGSTTGRSAGPGWPTWRRRDRLAATLRQASRLRVTGIAAGLHALLELPPGRAEDDLVARAARHGLAVEGLGPYCAPGHPRGPALVLGYGTPPEHAFTGALARLCAVLAE